MFGKIFKRIPKRFLGIDIGTSSIRIVELRRKGNIVALENYGELIIPVASNKPFRIFESDTLTLSDGDIAQAIQTICSDAGIQAKEVNFSIPDFSSFFTSFELPTMSKEELPDAVKYEVRPYIPLPLSEIYLDWGVIKGQVGKTPVEVLVVAVPVEVIKQYQEIARLSNLDLKILEPEVFSLSRALVKEKKVICLLESGARSTTCSIAEEGIVKMSHSFNIAGNELTELLAKSLNVEYEEAEKIKKEKGLVSQESSQDIKKVLLPLVDAIIGEIKKVFRNFYQKEGKEVEKIILAGGMALIPGLKDYISAELGKETAISDPFADIAYPPILAETLKKMGPTYAVSVGLVLKGFE